MFESDILPYVEDDTFNNTGIICIVWDNGRIRDLGNFFLDLDGEKCLVTTKTIAEKYGHLVSVPIYVKG